MSVSAVYFCLCKNKLIRNNPRITSSCITLKFGYRSKPKPLQKPGIEVTVKPNRTVKSKVPPVPRVDVDALLALEYSKEPSVASSSSQSSIRPPPEEV